MIKVSQLTKVYKTGELEVKALDGISFKVKKGEFVAIMGPSGSGKSTLMHILGALDVPSKGEYWLEGEKIADLDDDQLAEIRNRKIGFVFQAYNLLPRNTALRNVMIPMIYAGFSREKRLTLAKKYLTLVGLADRLYHAPNQLSGGQQQRVAIARALTMSPSIILADEPTGNIASQQAGEIMEIFTELNHRGHTVVMITHEKEIAQYAQRVIHLRDGRIVEDLFNGQKGLSKRKVQ